MVLAHAGRPRLLTHLLQVGVLAELLFSRKLGVRQDLSFHIIPDEVVGQKLEPVLFVLALHGAH